MEIKKRVLNLKYEGQQYSVAFPSVKDLKKYQSQFEKSKDDDVKAIEKSQEFLSELGLPMDISDQMEINDLKEIIEHISGQKKA